MVAAVGSGSIYDSMQAFRTQRGNAAASGLAASSAMASQIFGVDPSTNAALALFGIDTGSADGLFAATSEALESSLTIAMARVSFAQDTPTKADERTAAALAGEGLGSLVDLLA